MVSGYRLGWPPSRIFLNPIGNRRFTPTLTAALTEAVLAAGDIGTDFDAAQT
jgi:hypothetical protein